MFQLYLGLSLKNKGFTKPIGPSGHATIKDIIEYSNKNSIDVKKYTFFSTYTDPVHNFNSRFKHIINFWSGKVFKEDPGYIEHLGVSQGGFPSNKIISTVSEMLSLWTKDNEEKRIKRWFHDVDGNLRLDFIIHLNEKSIKRFCEIYKFKYTQFPHLNKICKPVSILDSEKSKILENYEYYKEITDNLNLK